MCVAYRTNKECVSDETSCGRSSVPLLSRHTTLSPRDIIMNSTLDMLPEGMMGDKQRSGVLGKALGFLMLFHSVYCGLY